MLWFYEFLFPALWIAFLFYWQIKAVNNKETRRMEPLGSRILRVVLFLIAFVLLLTKLVPFKWLYVQIWPFGLLSFWLGVVITIAGLSFAIWARGYIGKNWSRSVTIKQGHELVTSGPYKYVRHPIYTGILIGFLGTAIALTEVRGMLVFALIFFAFQMKLRMEEQWMHLEFGEAYADYANQTPALLPYVF